MNNLEYMTQEQLTAELVRGQRRQTKIRVIAAVVNAVILLTICAGLFRLIPPALDTMNDIEDVLAETGDLASQARESMKKADALMADADRLINDNSGSIADIMVKLNAIDFEKLNQSIQRLSEILEPLARLFGAKG